MNTDPRSYPPIAVVVCTLHRPDFLTSTLTAILHGQLAPRWLIIVNQSSRSASRPLALLSADPRVLWLRSAPVGLSRARNLGMATAAALGAEVVAFTDDDCIPTSGWLAGFGEIFGRHPELALVFGSTRAAAATHQPHGEIPDYCVAAESLYRGLRSKHRLEGMGACMAVRTVAWREIGGFDDWLGAGTNLGSAEENDLASRLLLAGYVLAETPAAVVVHHGARDARQLPGLVAGYMRGSGAAAVKMIRLAGLRAILPLLAVAWRWLRGQSPVGVTTRLSRRQRLRWYLQGAAVGCRVRLDRQSGRFEPWRGPGELANPGPITSGLD